MGQGMYVPQVGLLKLWGIYDLANIGFHQTNQFDLAMQSQIKPKMQSLHCEAFN